MFYVHSLFSTWVFHCSSIWISQENICGHICFGTNEEEKYESLPWTRFIKNWRVIAHFAPFQVLSHAFSERCRKQISMCEYMRTMIWFDPMLSQTELSKVFCQAGLTAHFKQWVPTHMKGHGMFFSFQSSSPNTQIGLKSVYFICYECLVGQQ